MLLALSSSSTETDAANQYYDNIDGCRGDLSKAQAVLAAMDWLILRNKPQAMTAAGRSVQYGQTFDSLYGDLATLVNAAARPGAPMFTSGRCVDAAGNLI